MRQSVSGSYLRLLHYPLHCHLLRGMSRYFFRGINQSKHDSNKEEKLTSPSLRIYQTNPHAPSPRIPDISAYINNQLNSPRTIHRKRLTLYKLPSAPTIHPSSKYPIFPTIAAIPHALNLAALLPTIFAKALKNCLSASVVSITKKCVKMPMIINSSSVGSDSIRERKAVSKE